MIHNVLCTHEEPQSIALAPYKWPGDDFLGVALPSRKALGRYVRVIYNGKDVQAQVVDLGPWCIDDHDYVFGESKPRAEILKGKFCPTTLDGNVKPTVPDGNGGMREVNQSNGAGIDLFPATATALGIKIGDNVYVEWCFIEEC